MCADNFSEERSLILRLIGGDEDAFCELYATYKNRLIYFAMRFLKSREYAEDVFQDAFASIAANEEKLKESIFSQALDYTEDTKREVMLNDLKSLISHALQQLTPRQREIFEMSREAQLSHKEIADKLGISVNTVQEHISTSLKLIRTYLIKYSGSEYVDLLLLLICLNT